MLEQLSDIQETYRSIFRSLYAEGDQADLADREDSIVAVAIAHREMSIAVNGDPEIEQTENDIVMAIDFLDHLDTLNFEVTSK